MENNSNNGFSDERSESQNDQRQQGDSFNSAGNAYSGSGEFSQDGQETPSTDYDNEQAGDLSQTQQESGYAEEDDDSDDFDDDDLEDEDDEEEADDEDFRQRPGRSRK